MKLLDIHGRPRSKMVSRYLIDWDKKSKSKIQFKVKQFLKTYWENHIVYEEFPVYGTRMKVDFINVTKKMAVEVHGPQHESFNKFFHKNSRAASLDSIKRAAKKTSRNCYYIFYICWKYIRIYSLRVVGFYDMVFKKPQINFP